MVRGAGKSIWRWHWRRCTDAHRARANVPRLLGFGLGFLVVCINAWRAADAEAPTIEVGQSGRGCPGRDAADRLVQSGVREVGGEHRLKVSVRVRATSWCELKRRGHNGPTRGTPVRLPPRAPPAGLDRCRSATRCAVCCSRSGRGRAQRIADLLAGRVPVMSRCYFNRAHQEVKLRALAATSATRSEVLADVRSSGLRRNRLAGRRYRNYARRASPIPTFRATAQAGCRQRECWTGCVHADDEEFMYKYKSR